MRRFLYCRKSQEAEDRQVQSLESQNAEALARFGNDGGAAIEAFDEAMSAKAPGRPIFNKMMERIEAGEADCIIAWAPDRLARNAVDGGRIIHLLDTGKLKNLQFLTYTFENNSQGKFMLSIMFGQSKYYSDALSDNVKRGNRAKATRGWRPSSVPLGYRHNKDTKEIEADPAYFPLIRRMFDLALTGGYSSRRIARIAVEEWGMRSPAHWKRGGTPLAPGSVHRILLNEFYAGTFVVQGETHVGRHPAMLSRDEFERVKAAIRRPVSTRAHKHSFPFTGLIRCGTCGREITAEHKVNAYGSRYVYYHCSKSGLGPRCPERSVRAEDLEQQLAAWLRTIDFGDETSRRLQTALEEYGRRSSTSILAIRQSLERALRDTQGQAAELVGMRARSLITDEEFAPRRAALKDEIVRLTRRLEELALPDDKEVIPQIVAAISLSKQAAELFEAGPADLKRQIVKIACSNLRLTNKILSVEAAKWLCLMRKIAACLCVRGRRDEVRTLGGGPITLGLCDEAHTLDEDTADLLSAADALLRGPETAAQLAIIREIMAERPQRPEVHAAA